LTFHPTPSECRTGLDASKSDQDGTKTRLSGAPTWEDDHIISLNSDGFTVGDGTPSSNLVNVNIIVYTYIAWKA
jgi:hypothetical protein